MEHLARHRRGFLGAAAAALLAALAPATGSALELPAGKVVLTVSGNSIADTNERGAASFDLAMLEKLPQHSFSTRTPWYAQPRKFSGVLLRDLLAAIGSPADASLNAIALNDYRVGIPREDLAKNDVMLAYLLDDKPMSVREKGPLLIIYPFDDKPELRTAVHYSRAIWQLRSLELR